MCTKIFRTKLHDNKTAKEFVKAVVEFTYIQCGDKDLCKIQQNFTLLEGQSTASRYISAHIQECYVTFQAPSLTTLTICEITRKIEFLFLLDSRSFISLVWFTSSNTNLQLAVPCGEIPSLCRR